MGVLRQSGIAFRTRSLYVLAASHPASGSVEYSLRGISQDEGLPCRPGNQPTLYCTQGPKVMD